MRNGGNPMDALAALLGGGGGISLPDFDSDEDED